jgi:hypothetical protein
VVDIASGKEHMERSMSAKSHPDLAKEFHEKRGEDQKAGPIKMTHDPEGHPLWEHHYYNPSNPYTKHSSSLFAWSNATHATKEALSGIKSYMHTAIQKLRKLAASDSEDDPGQVAESKAPDSDAASFRSFWIAVCMYDLIPDRASLVA